MCVKKDVYYVRRATGNAEASGCFAIFVHAVHFVIFFLYKCTVSCRAVFRMVMPRIVVFAGVSYYLIASCIASACACLGPFEARQRMGKAKIMPWGPRAGGVRIERVGGENPGDQVREVGQSSGDYNSVAAPRHITLIVTECVLHSTSTGSVNGRNSTYFLVHSPIDLTTRRTTQLTRASFYPGDRTN